MVYQVELKETGATSCSSWLTRSIRGSGDEMLPGPGHKEDHKTTLVMLGRDSMGHGTCKVPNRT